MTYIEALGANAKASEKALRCASAQEKNKILGAIAEAIVSRSAEILAANEKDLAAAKENGMSAAMQDRLRLTEERIKGIAFGSFMM